MKKIILFVMLLLIALPYTASAASYSCDFIFYDGMEVLDSTDITINDEAYTTDANGIIALNLTEGSHTLTIEYNDQTITKTISVVEPGAYIVDFQDIPTEDTGLSILQYIIIIAMVIIAVMLLYMLSFGRDIIRYFKWEKHWGKKD